MYAQRRRREVVRRVRVREERAQVGEERLGEGRSYMGDVQPHPGESAAMDMAVPADLAGLLGVGDAEEPVTPDHDEVAIGWAEMGVCQGAPGFRAFVNP